LRALVVVIKARWVGEQAHQQLKEELGLDHFEGRSWSGLHHHAVLAMIAYAFLQTMRLRQRLPNSQRPNGPPPQPSLPALRPVLGWFLSALAGVPGAMVHLPCSDTSSGKWRSSANEASPQTDE
jgi:hypothetical protein